MQDLNVTLIQTRLAWEDISSNLSMFDEKIDSINEETDLIILPEMFTTGFSMNAERLAVEMDNASVIWMRDKSRKINADIMGSIMIMENHKYYNRLIWIKPDGRLFTYDKRHLFRVMDEDKTYTAGNNLITVEIKGWKIRPFICYDLRFPAWIRNLNNRYDAAVFIANWPEPRSVHWKTLLCARSIENLCYVIGVNRVGKDGNGILFKGDSSVIDPTGMVLFQKPDLNYIHTARLSWSFLQEYRKNFPAWLDADNDLITFPGDKS